MCGVDVPAPGAKTLASFRMWWSTSAVVIIGELMAAGDHDGCTLLSMQIHHAAYMEASPLMFRM
jgi:hypothetical protein